MSPRLSHISVPLAVALALSACSEPERAPAAPAAAEAPAARCDDGAHRGPGSSCAMPSLHAEKGPAEIAAAGTPQLIEFEAAYCAACATMAPVVTSIVKSCAKASQVVRRVDVDGAEGEALARHYGVAALPTFLAVDADGQEVFRRTGVQAPAELATLVAEVSGEGCSAKN
jgi:thiol-disulfide isomerase/thioredoxin